MRGGVRSKPGWRVESVQTTTGAVGSDSVCSWLGEPAHADSASGATNAAAIIAVRVLRAGLCIIASQCP